ncbi:hypothetical protein WT02_15965 [Burkholderia stagnalis]|nr:hypothetical protein WT03_10800 [Burkholderia stagnalis]KVL96554.1 hypothetical protein WT02_15965 [Burkholderia stagnalis]KVM13409.1 hypothetical protein WT04_10115 [Burkholderia stagnalis]
MREPSSQGAAQAITREYAVRISTELGQYGRSDELAATRLIEIGSFTIELAAVLSYEPNANEVTFNKVGELCIDEDM